jgi:hypothetical protein
MLYKERSHLANKFLADAAMEGQQIMLVGSGVWFQGLECALYRLHREHYPGHTLVCGRDPLMRAIFHSGGSIQCVDLGNGRNISLLDSDEGVVPQIIYLVEDVHGVHASIWKDRVRPFLRGTACRVVYLGEKDDQSQ